MEDATDAGAAYTAGAGASDTADVVAMALLTQDSHGKHATYTAEQASQTWRVLTQCIDHCARAKQTEKRTARAVAPPVGPNDASSASPVPPEVTQTEGPRRPR